MELKKSEGCTAFYTLVDGYNIAEGDLSEETWQEFSNALQANFQVIRNCPAESRQGLIEDLIYYLGEITYESEEACGSCGDYVIQYTLELPVQDIQYVR